jgi:hypothetical protein
MWTRSGLAAGLSMFAALACSTPPVPVTAQRLGPLPHGEIRYVAVLPFESAPGVGDAVVERGQEVRPEPPAVTVQRAMTDAMARLPGWRLTDDILVGEGLRKLFGEIRPVTEAEATDVGRLLGVDAVLHGVVRRFEPRIGSEYSAKRPALVDFAVRLVGFPAGTAVWEGEFAEQQQPLSDNLWNLFGFVRARGKWLRAGELAAVGARGMAGEMHHALYGGKATPIPPR